MPSTQVVETSVANNSPSQDSSHPDDHFQSRYVTPGFKPFSYKQILHGAKRVGHECDVVACHPFFVAGACNPTSKSNSEIVMAASFAIVKVHQIKL